MTYRLIIIYKFRLRLTIQLTLKERPRAQASAGGRSLDARSVLVTRLLGVDRNPQGWCRYTAGA